MCPRACQPPRRDITTLGKIESLTDVKTFANGQAHFHQVAVSGLEARTATVSSLAWLTTVNCLMNATVRSARTESSASTRSGQRNRGSSTLARSFHDDESVPVRPRRER